MSKFGDPETLSIWEKTLKIQMWDQYLPGDMKWIFGKILKQKPSNQKKTKKT